MEEFSWTLALVIVVPTTIVMLATGWVLKEFARRGADGRLKRNRLAGMRTAKTLASDEAWLAGHQAALPLTLKAGDVTLWTSVAAIALPAIVGALGAFGPVGFIAWWTIVLMIGVIALTAMVFRAMVLANRAAETVAPLEP